MRAFITNPMCLINVLNYLNMCLIKHSFKQEHAMMIWLFARGEQ